jgi:hypothetical protein
VSDKIRIMLRVLGGATAFWLVLMVIARLARNGVLGFTTNDFDVAFIWATGLLGLGATLGGFLGLGQAAQKGEGVFSAGGSGLAEGSLIGILAGTTLLGVGGAGVPIALAGLVIGLAGARLFMAAKGSEGGRTG